MKKIFLITLLILANSCSALAIDYSSNKTVAKGTDVDDYIAKHNSKNLTALNEDSLWEKRNIKGPAVYRFLSFPTWDNPFAITFKQNEDGTAKLIVRQTDGRGGYDPGKLFLDKVVNLNKQQTNEVLNKLTKLDFWNLPREINRGGVVDGTAWIIEGIQDGKYHAVERDRESSYKSDFRDTFKFMIGLTQ